MRKVATAIKPEEVRDYPFRTPEGERRLSELFGGERDLFVIHNMGSSCPYCTLWADGYNGIYPRLASRAGFVVSSPDAPEVQSAFAASREWRIPMVSHTGSSFAQTCATAPRVRTRLAQHRGIATSACSAASPS